MLLVWGIISALFRQGNTASFEEMLQRWLADDNIVCDLTGQKFGPQSSRSIRNKRVTAQHTKNIIYLFNLMKYTVFAGKSYYW